MKVAAPVLAVVLAAGAAIAAAQNSYTNTDPQKGETNRQAPPAAQPNSGQMSAAPPPANSVSPGSAPAASGSSPADSDPAENAALQGRIQQALGNEPTLSTSHVSVRVTDNTIELSGTAASGKDKLTAERIAESFNGNRKFDDNKLLVIGQSPAAQQK